jgi:hypothetical protein
LQGATSIPLPDKNYWKEIVTNGTPSKEELITDLKNFFEGPINMDLMILGSLKNILQDSESQLPLQSAVKNAIG